MATPIPKNNEKRKKEGKKKVLIVFFSFSFPLLPDSFGISSTVITLTLTSVTKAMINL